LPVVQSASELQLNLQALVPQTYGAQLCVVAVVQLPLPEQKVAGVKVVPLQEALPHCTLDEACWQAPLPLQAPVLPQVVLVGQRLCGSAPFAPTLAQVPLPEMLQAWQVGQLPVLQQTPSTQWAPLHS
jgi:hypothetical protein